MARDKVPTVKTSLTRHSGHCFVVMPFGRDTEEQRWFSGWYSTVIHPAIESSGLEPVLAAAQDQPSAINDEIRSHLAFDDMVIVDLAGRHPADPPNPNVMYELGLRHAFGLPVVVMAWEGQQLPFDVNNQRAIMSRRDFLDIEPTRQRLVRFIRAAQEGNFYNPMEAVGREAQIETTSMVLGEESLLSALAAEVRDLRATVTNSRRGEQLHDWKASAKIKTAMGREKRSEVWEWAQEQGVEPTTWGKYLNLPLPKDIQTAAADWSVPRWIEHFSASLPSLPVSKRKAELDRSIIEQVRDALPPQPWATGIHRSIAEQLGLPASTVTRAITVLINEGAFVHQIDGELETE